MAAIRPRNIEERWNSSTCYSTLATFDRENGTDCTTGSTTQTQATLHLSLLSKQQSGVLLNYEHGEEKEEVHLPLPNLLCIHISKYKFMLILLTASVQCKYLGVPHSL